MIKLAKSITPVIALFSAFLMHASYAADGHISVAIKAHPFAEFEPSKPQRKDFGALRFVSGTVFETNENVVGGFSGLQMLDQGRRLIAISDSGYWLFADIKRADDGTVNAIENTSMTRIFSGVGPRGAEQKHFRDAEGLASSDKAVFVSFEASNTLSKYVFEGSRLNLEPVVLALPDALKKADYNKGMEALAFAPKGSPLAGHLVAVLERGGRRADPGIGYILAPIAKGQSSASSLAGRFTIRKDRLFDFTEATFLENGDLLLLERKFTVATGAGMRIRRIKSADIKAGTHLDGEILIEAGISNRIDNMEAMSVYKNADGETVVALMSDDNHSLLQRTLLLEFVLKD